MDEYIEREAAIRAIVEAVDSGLATMAEALAEILGDLPAAEVEPMKYGPPVEFPFIAMVEQSLQGGKMTPQSDQRFNGRYAVVYFNPKKWKIPLIDICGKKRYDREEAEVRMAELNSQEAEEALREEAENG